MTARAALTPNYTISRVIKGGWHLAGDHGAIEPDQACRDMAAFVENGITTFDCADIYVGVEELIGRFRRDYPSLAKQVQIHTKFVPDLSDLATLGAPEISRAIDRSLSRLGVERLDLVQFHWWDYTVEGWLDAAFVLADLQRDGKIAHIGITNFDSAHTQQMVGSGVPVITHQVQYSLLDGRPGGAMTSCCAAHGIGLLCYGTVAGGFLSERWLDVAEPSGGFSNRSLTKYKLIIDDFGGWDLFQQLLAVLQRVAQRHVTDIATIASAAILARPQVAAVIVGATNRAHLDSNRRTTEIALTAADLGEIETILRKRQGPQGDVYDLERDRSGRHGQVMKYELNKKEKGISS